MRTTSKEFCEKVQSHILECLDMEDVNTTKEAFERVLNEFSSWYGNYEQRRNPNIYTAFWDFLMGLPDCFTPLFYYDDMRCMLKEWFQQSDEEASKYDSAKVASTYSNLVIREFIKMCKKEGIDFMGAIHYVYKR